LVYNFEPMCTSLKTLSNTKNGALTFCTNSKLFQLVFNNLCFEFYEWELESFKEHLKTLDINYWEKQAICAIHTRKIPISIGHKCFIILVNREEISEIKQLLHILPRDSNLLSIKDFSNAISLN